MRIALWAVGLVGLIVTLLPFSRSQRWWVRACDFPRLQAAALLAAAGLPLPWLGELAGPNGLLLAALVPAFVYQVARIWPYTPLGRKESFAARSTDPRRRLRLFVANVLMTNRRSEGLLELIAETSPDVVILLEPDGWWEERLRGLERSYKAAKCALDNTYGMLVYSRLPWREVEIRFLVNEEIPSIFARLELPTGDLVDLWAVHPLPPAPQEAETSVERDAELVLVGRTIAKLGRPALAAGDLNDVAWSHTTHLFQRVSGMLDPRRGRGMFNTFHAGLPLLRYPLDHVFHSPDFRLVKIERCRGFGSDHFPIAIELSFEPEGSAAQPPPEPSPEDRQEAREIVQRGLG